MLKAKRHLLLEKPIAVTLAASRRLIAAHKAHCPDKVFMVAENAQYWPEIVETARLLEEGAIGEVLSARAKFWESAMGEWCATPCPLLVLVLVLLVLVLVLVLVLALVQPPVLLLVSGCVRPCCPCLTLPPPNCQGCGLHARLLAMRRVQAPRRLLHIRRRDPLDSTVADVVRGGGEGDRAHGQRCAPYGREYLRLRMPCVSPGPSDVHVQSCTLQKRLIVHDRA